MAKTRVEFPDGTIVEISPDLKPDQITALVSALKSGQPIKEVEAKVPDQVIEVEYPTAEDIFKQGSKREQMALFIRNNFTTTYWFTAKEVRDQQLQFVSNLIFGETPAIHTYLKRLADDDYLARRVYLNNQVQYQLTNKMCDEYPEIQLDKMTELLVYKARSS